MASDDDPENQANLNEETPLINDHRPETPDDSNDELKSKPQASWYIWRALWALFAVFALTVFIKGWIDAGSDVNVNPLAEILIYT